MGFLDGLFGGDAEKEAKRARRTANREAREREAAITAGTAKVRGAFESTYTDDFYNGLRAALENYYLPQAETQFQDAQKDTVYGLTRQGLRQSSERGERFGDIQSRFDLAKQDIVRRGQGLVDNRKSEVGRALENAILQINAAEDPFSAAEIGANNSSLMTYAPEYQPLGQVFADLTNAFAEQSRADDRGTNRYNTPSWLGWMKSSGGGYS